MEFARGVKTSDLKVIGKSTKTGTKVSFKPDPEIFPDIEFKYEMLIGRIRELAYLNQGLRIIVEDERIGKTRGTEIRKWAGAVHSKPERGKSHRCIR